MSQSNSRQIQGQQQQQMQTLSPQQILIVRLLELPALELEDRVRAELLENPALEEGHEDAHDEYTEPASESETSVEDGGNTEYDSLSDYLTEDDIPDYKLQERNRTWGERMEEIPFSDTTSFYETLQAQLGERALTEEEREVAEYLVGSLDNDGFLRKPLAVISDELAIYSGIDTTPDQLERLLKVIQDFEPAGIGARNLQECLLLQVRRKQEQGEADPLLPVEELILTRAYDEFSRKHWDKIELKLELPADTIREAIEELRRLNPRPGAALGEVIGKNMQQIVPDFLLDVDDEGGISFALNNSHVPELRMNRDFKQMAREHTLNAANQSKESKEAMLFLRQKMEAAQGFIDAIKTRQNTLMVTMQAIVELQRPFFREGGDEALLKPMILKDVAERAGLDISTVSRVSNSKYVQTPFGIYPLKFFFSDGYKKEDGEELSLREIRKIIRECIDAEDKQQPYTDDELAEVLKEKGYPMARRTVAKHRQQLNIPVARLRRGD